MASSLLSLTQGPVSSLSAQTNILQPAALFVSDVTNQLLHRPHTGAATDSECLCSMHSSASVSGSLHQTKQFHPAACSLTSSHLEMLRTPARVVTQSSCPPAPRRRLPLRLYEGLSQGHASSAESTDCSYLQAPADTAASLRRLMQEAKAVNSVQDMLCRLRPDAPSFAHSQQLDSAGSTPVLVKARPVTLEGGTNLPAYQDVWQAKRMKLFGPARGCTPTDQCVQPRYTEKLQLLQSQPCPPTAHSEPDTDRSELATVQTDLVTASTDSFRDATGQITGRPLCVDTLALPKTSGMLPVAYEFTCQGVL